MAKKRMHETSGHPQDFVDTHFPQHPVQKRKALIVELQGMINSAKYTQMMMYAHAWNLNASEHCSYQSPGIDIPSHANLSE